MGSAPDATRTDGARPVRPAGRYAARVTGQRLRADDFDYELPDGAIAQTPAEPRDSSRLLVMHRSDGRLEDAWFRELGAWLEPGDLLITGTPPGVGEGKKPEAIFLKAGDTMTLSIDKLGTQTQAVVAWAHPRTGAAA